jgi:nucleoid-associated protein YgaU
MRSTRLLVFGAVVLAPWFATSAASDEAPGAAGTWGAPSAETPTPEGAAMDDQAPSPAPEAESADAGGAVEQPEGSNEALSGSNEALSGSNEALSASSEALPAAGEMTEADAAVEQPEATDVVPAAFDAAGETPAAEVEISDPEESMNQELPQVPAEVVAESAPVLPGEIGYDGQGRPGHIHVVVSGDTLWDISDLYLGTPWVWPSIWNDNESVENPHLIVPGDRIWITPSEMRRITAEEAYQLMAGSPAAPEPELIDAGSGIDGDEFAVPQPVTMPDADQLSNDALEFPVSGRDTIGLVAAERLESAASIVDALPGRVMLGQEDKVYIGLGAGDVAVGEQFMIFRSREKVIDPDTKRILGYHVDILGWLEVQKVHKETSTAVIRMSNAEVERGDRIMPREQLPGTVAVQSSPAGVEGKLSYFARSRTMMGQVDYVYLNRGTLDGLQVGSPLEVFRAGYKGRESARNQNVELPSKVVAHMLVVKAEPETSVAFVTHTHVELELGDTFRGATH